MISLLCVVSLQTTPAEAAQAFLEKGFIPNISDQTVFNLDDSVLYTFLVHGRVKAAFDSSNMEFVGPAYIPKKVRVLQFNVSLCFQYNLCCCHYLTNLIL